jgi:hypothetical protein
MRRLLFMGFLVVMGTSLVSAVALFSLACRGRLDVSSRLAEARREIEPPARTVAPDQPRATAEGWVRAASAHLVSSMLNVKQRDAIAYPAHVAVARLLGRTTCGPDAVRTQWLKAGIHAQGERQVEVVVAGLRETLTDDGDLSHLQAMIEALAQAESWSNGLLQVRERLGLPAP